AGAPAALGKAVAHAAVGTGRVGEIFDRVLDRLGRNLDAGVAGGAQALELGDGDGALVELIVVLGGDVAPAAPAGPGVAGELAGPRQDVFELAALLLVLLIAVDAGEEQQTEAVPVHVANALALLTRVADEAIGLRLGHEPVPGATEVLGVFAGADSAA